MDKVNQKNSPSQKSTLPAVVTGGGAAGFFAAIACAEKNPGQPVIILEQGHSVLAKVRISGGGRCNVTHACFDPKKLVTFYPRGGKELLGPFHQFQPQDTMTWFSKRGVSLKTEEDGRVFPVSDSSQTIIDALTEAASAARVEVRSKAGVVRVAHGEDNKDFVVVLENGSLIPCSKILLATGSGRNGFEWARKFGHTIKEPVPSLFTFHVHDKRLRGLEGISVPKAHIEIPGTKLKQTGPLLITHAGLSGPAVLKLSAWGARALSEAGYHAELVINWVDRKPDEIEQGLRDIKNEYAKRSVTLLPAFGTPRRLWERFVEHVGISDTQKWADLSREKMTQLTTELIAGRYILQGKSPFKEEFVTCGGVSLSEVNFKTMESRLCPGLYFAGEILDVDAVTGGFNFQNAWTTGWMAGQAMAEK